MLEIERTNRIHLIPVATMLLLLLSVVMPSCSGNDNGGDDVLVRNDIYTITADSVIEGDDVAFSPDGFSISSRYKGLSHEWKRHSNNDGAVGFKSQQPIVDAIYNMSLDAVEQYVKAGASDDSRLLNHERCYYIERVLAILNPEISKKILRSMTDGKMLTGASQSPMLGGHHIWAEAAWQIYVVTGDKQWLRESHDLLLNTLKNEEALDITDEKLLMHGSAPFLSVKAYYPQWMDQRELYSTFSLDENVMVCHAYSVLYDMGYELNRINEYNTTSDHMKERINSGLWSEPHSSYSQFSYGSIYQAQSPRTDNLGQAMAVLWDIADDDRAETLIEESPITHYGVTAIYPCVVDSFQHLGTLAMPLLQSYWNMAAARVSNTNMLRRGFGTMIRSQALAASCNVTVDATTGDIDIGGGYTMANACGNLAMYYRVLAGMNFLPDGIEFNPCVPKGMGGTKTISNFKYRNATLRINIKGTGNDLKTLKLDGKQQDINFITNDLTGYHVIDIEMNNIDSDAGKVTIALAGRALPNPPVTEWHGSTCHILNYDASQGYRVLINDRDAYSISDSIFTLTDTTSTARVVSLVAINRWGDSFRSLPHYITPHPIGIDMTASDVSDDSTTLVLNFQVAQAGNYLMWLNYDVNDRAAARMVAVNTHPQGMIVMPLNRITEYSPISEKNALPPYMSNMIKISLLKGKNTITLGPPNAQSELPHFKNDYRFYSLSLVKM